MKLSLDKNWYKARIAQEGDLDVTAGVPLDEHENTQAGTEQPAQPTEDAVLGLHVFGSLVQMLRRERRLSVEQLAVKARVDAVEIVAIERDPRFIPKPRTVHQLAHYFRLPERALAKLSNITTVHSSQLEDAAVRFAANSESVMELNREERQALADFVKFLVSGDAG